MHPDQADRQAAPAEFMLDHFLPYRVAVLAERMSRSLARVYSARFGITIPEWRILAQLNHHASLCAWEVAEHTNMDKPRVSRALVRLSRAQLIHRQRSSRDRRVAVLELSAQGRRLVREIIPYALAWQQRLERLVGARGSAELAELCTRITVALKAADGDPG